LIHYSNLRRCEAIVNGLTSVRFHRGADGIGCCGRATSNCSRSS
jgi:hypothetical protein